MAKGEIRKKTQLLETHEGSNVFVWIGNLPGNAGYTSGMPKNRFKIVNGLDSWTGYRAANQYTDITNKEGEVFERPADISDYPDNFWFVKEEGTYKVTVDLNKKKISCFKHVEPAKVGEVYQISTFSDLVWFSDYVNTQKNTNANAKLTADIQQDSHSYSSIGTSANPYKGCFDGGGHSVTMNLNNSNADHLGIFGVLTGGADIKNIIVKGDIKGKQYVGGIAGAASGEGEVKINCCGNDATITATGANAGGILGANIENKATVIITNCYNKGDIVSAKESGALTGGLGKGGSKMENCYNTGSVVYGEMTATDFARNDGAELKNCYYEDKTGTNGQDNQGVASVKYEDVGNGKLCFLLGSAFRQTIGTDIYPMFGDEHMKVYGNNGDIYSNFGVTITDAKYATLIAPANLLFTGHKVKAFGAKVQPNSILLTPATTVVLEEKIVVYADEAGEYALPKYSDMPMTLENNDLQVSDEEITADGSQYVLAKPEGKEVGFYKATSGKIDAGKCYIKIESSTKEAYSLTFEQETITEINIAKAVENNYRIFNLKGQQLSKPVKGINIINGRKVLVK